MIQPTNVQQPYPQQGGANAVSINIYNPQAYGSGNNPNACQTQAPYQYTNSVYSMPQTSVYNEPQQAIQQAPYQQLIPAQSPIIAPAPQMMPNSVMDTPAESSVNTDMSQPNTPEAQQDIQVPQAQEANQAQETNGTQNSEGVNRQEQNQNIQQPQATIDVDGLINELKSNDADKKAEAINKIAALTQESPESALQVVSEPVMQSLVDVIKEDTNSLEGPSDKQIEVAEKITKGEKLTPEEEQLAEQLSPRDKANKNRIFALYTLAMIQKLQRDELNQYIETQKENGQQTIEPLKIQDLIGYNDIVNVIKNDSRPEVKVAAIQALQYVAEESDKAEVESVLADALNSEDEAIKTAAQETMTKFQNGNTTAGTQTNEQTAAQNQNETQAVNESQQPNESEDKKETK